MNSPTMKDSIETRRLARRMRDHHWKVLERMKEHDPLWCCWWDKKGKYDTRHYGGVEPPPDVEVFGLIDAMEFGNWMRRHPDWIEHGEWSDERYAEPVRITDAGREALRNRHLYDMEPVEGGMVEPGWQAIPLPHGHEALIDG